MARGDGKAVNAGLLALQAISSALPVLDEYRQQKRRQTEIDRGAEETRQAQRAADARVGDLVSSFETQQAPLHAAMPDYQAAVRRARTQGNASMPGGEALGMGADTQAYGNRYAKLVSGLDAAGLQRELEGHRIGRAGADVGALQRQASTADYLAGLRARRVRGNPWAALLSELGTRVARNYSPKQPRRTMDYQNELIDSPTTQLKRDWQYA